MTKIDKRVMLAVCGVVALLWLANAAHQSYADARLALDPAVTYEALVNNASTMTDAQWGDYVLAVQGTRVQWTGYVEDAREGATGLLDVDMNATSAATVGYSDATVPVATDALSSYNRGQRVTWQGVIDELERSGPRVRVTFRSARVVVQP
jgi:hypothetical protein